MKLAEVEVGGHYVAVVSGHRTVVRVVAVERRWDSLLGQTRPRVRAVNLRTGRDLVLRGAGRLRRFVPAEKVQWLLKEYEWVDRVPASPLWS